MIIYDYADVRIPMLDRMFRRRLRGYDAIGYRLDGPDARRLPLWNEKARVESTTSHA